MQATCGHLSTIDPGRPAPLDVCPTCVEMGSPWVHLRQCLVCGATNCCDSSPNRHASKHFASEHHPLMQTLEADEDWAWCFVDELTLRPGLGDSWRVVDPFFEAGVWYVQQALENGATFPFPPDTTTEDGFPLSVWERTVRGKHRDGTLDPDQVAEVEELPGWHW